MIKALAFDVFGTVLDWRGTIAAEGKQILGDDSTVDWDALAVAWSKQYAYSISHMAGWTNLDVMLATAFYRVAPQFGLLEVTSSWESHILATSWSRLKPWPDAPLAFDALSGFTLAAFTNANHAMLESLSASSRLPWSVLLSAESVHRYKPDPAIYRMALDELDLRAEEVMLVAAHCFDLNAAHRLGIHTALITRPTEPGSDPSGLDHEADVIAPDLNVFAQMMNS